MSKQIQWFPGHMTKTINELKELKFDAFFILLDSRAPQSSFIDSFKDVIQNKKVFIILNKSDLVNTKDLKKWIDFFKNKYDNVLSLTLVKNSNVKKQIFNLLEKEKFKNLIPKIGILGAPNVGKSSLLNILIGNKSAKVENRPGVTKNNNWYQFEKKYWILDTPGLLQPKFMTEEQGINLALIGSIKLDILPLDLIAHSLIVKLIDQKQIDNHLNSESYFKNIKDNYDEYKKIILDFQKGKWNKTILE